MPKKFRRRGSVFHKQHQTAKYVLGCVATGICIVAVVAAGFWWAKTFVGGSLDNSTSSAPESAAPSPESSPADSEPPVPSQPDNSDTSTPTPTLPSGTLRAFYAPVSLLRDSAALDVKLDKAAAAGLNAVVFDLKDEAGNLYYATATELGVKANAAVADALTLDELTALQTQLKEKGFTAIPRLFAFKDAVSPRSLPTAKVTLESNPGYTWYDGNPQTDGKPWLNPYAPDAHRYISDLAVELKGIGFTALMLDGVQFPNQESSAYYGNTELSSLSRGDVLKKFVTDLRTQLDGCALLLSMPGLSAFGDETTPFGGNPLTFGAAIAAPNVMPSEVDGSMADPYESVKTAISQLQLRLRLIDEEERPQSMPWLQAYECTATQLDDQIRALKEAAGDDASYILYHPDGTYPFG